MIKVHYRTNAAFERNPVAFTVPAAGLKKEDYELVNWIAGELKDFSLEEVFRRMNEVGTERSFGLRSMSCGDVVETSDRTLWFCAATGWERATWVV